MPAPLISITPHPGQLTHQVPPVDVRGWRLNMTLSQPNATGPFSWNVSTSQFDLTQIPVEDRGTSISSIGGTFVTNEVPSIAAMRDKLQAIADTIADHLIPSP